MMFNIDSSFDLQKTLDCGQCFHYELNEDGSYSICGENIVCIAKQEKGILNVKSNDLNAEEYWYRYFDLGRNYYEINEYLKEFSLKCNDSFAFRAIEYGTGIHILNQPIFETVCSFIISQRNNIPRIKRTVKNISERFQTMPITLNDKMYYCFPAYGMLRNIKESEYKEVGLGYRAEYLELLCKNWEGIEKNISFEYNIDKEILMKNKGIGEKVSNCICLFGLHEFDAFPVDVWMKKILKEEYEDKEREFILPNKYAGVLQQYMFYYKRAQV